MADRRDAGPGQALQLALERLATVADVLVAVLLLEPLPDLLAGVRGPDDREPVARRPVLGLRRHDLDDVAVLQAIVERHQPVVDLGADRPVTDVGVDPIGEVERRGTRRQVLDVALRREDEHLVLEDVELDAFDELGRVADLALPVHQLAQPGQLGVVVALGLGALLVAPVRRDPDLADGVHRVGPDLDLERLAVERDHGRVEALVAVRLGNRDVVVELARDRLPEAVDDAQRRVAVPDLVHQQADRVDVVDLAEGRRLALHLLPDGEEVLRAAIQVALDPVPGELRLEDRDRPLDVALAARPARVEVRRQLAVALRVEVLEREVLQLPLDLPDAQPLGQGRVDLHGLARDPELLLRREAGQRAHVVEPIGQLDEDDPDVLGHREQHLADVLGLLLLVRVGGELGQLRDAVHEVGDFRAEVLLDVGQGLVGVLRHVVEQRRLDRGEVQGHLGERLGRGDRVSDVGLAGGPALVAVGHDREVERALHRPEVGLGVMAGDLRQERLAKRRQ